MRRLSEDESSTVTIYTSGRHIRLDNVVLNPWLQVVSEFYHDLEATNSSKARQRIENESLLELLRFDSPRLSADDGDLNNGTGFVVLEKVLPAEDRDEYLRVDVRRTLAGPWKITAVTQI